MGNGILLWLLGIAPDPVLLLKWEHPAADRGGGGFWSLKARRSFWNLSPRRWGVAVGVELLMAAAVDVVLLDCVLPGETTWQIALETDRQNEPFAILSGLQCVLEASFGALHNCPNPSGSTGLKQPRTTAEIPGSHRVNANPPAWAHGRHLRLPASLRQAPPLVCSRILLLCRI